MNREAWHAAIHGVVKSRTQLSDWTELNWTWLHWSVKRFQNNGAFKFCFNVQSQETLMASLSHTHGHNWPHCVWGCVCAMLSHVRLFGTSWRVAYQAPLSLGFPRQEYWSGLSFASPGDLPNPGMEPGFLRSPAWQILYHCTTQEASINDPIS